MKNPPPSGRSPPPDPPPTAADARRTPPITTLETLEDTHFDVDDLRPVTDEDESRLDDLCLGLDLLICLGVQHATNPHTELLSDSFYVVFDGSMTWADIPGMAQYAAIHVERDLGEGTYRLDYSRHPIAALAQNWLISRGADQDQLPAEFEDPMDTDQATRDLEEALAASGDRFQILDDYTYDSSDFYKTWIIAVDNRPEPGQHPVRVFYEDTNMEGHSYTLRQGGFATVDAARSWVDRLGEPDNSLPPLTAAPSARAAGAAAQSSAAVMLSAPSPAPAPVTAEGRPARPKHR